MDDAAKTASYPIFRLRQHFNRLDVRPGWWIHLRTGFDNLWSQPDRGVCDYTIHDYLLFGGLIVFVYAVFKA